MQEQNSVGTVHLPWRMAHMLYKKRKKEPPEHRIWCAPAASVPLLTNGYDWAKEIRFSGELSCGSKGFSR